MAGGRLGPVGQHAGQAAVAGDPGRPRAGLVQDLADQVVGEPVAGAGLVLDQQAGGQGTLGPGGRDLDRQLQQGGHDLQVDGRPGHHRRPQQGLDLRAGPPGPGQDRVAERRRDPGLVLAGLGGRPQRLHREQGVAPGPLQHRAGQAGHAEPAGQLGHRLRRQGAQLQDPPGVGQACSGPRPPPRPGLRPATSTRSPARRRSRKWSSSRVDAPAWWRSSTTSSSGCRSARPRTKLVTASNDRRRSSSAGARS